MKHQTSDLQFVLFIIINIVYSYNNVLQLFINFTNGVVQFLSQNVLKSSTKKYVNILKLGVRGTWFEYNI